MILGYSKQGDMPIEPVHEFDGEDGTRERGIAQNVVEVLQVCDIAKIRTEPAMTAPIVADYSGLGCKWCAHAPAVDRAECNACARQWPASGCTEFAGFERQYAVAP